MKQVVISGTGLATPPEGISNEELVASFNTYVERFNQENAAKIENGEVEALKPSSCEFIEKASGIKHRYLHDKANVLDPDVMYPYIPPRTDDEPCFQAEFAVNAVHEALKTANKEASEIDAVILSSGLIQRSFPAVSIEIQKLLGIQGFGFDMNVACSSATFGINMAHNLIQNGQAKSILVCGAEVARGSLNLRDRDSHFIFGEAATAVVVEDASVCKAAGPFAIKSFKLHTQFSSNIRNNFSPICDRTPEELLKADKFFYQAGRKVFKDIVPLVPQIIVEHLKNHDLAPTDLRRMWLHQANSHMNDFIAKKLLGAAPTQDSAPMILDQYGNTGSCGSVIAFHKYHKDLQAGDKGVMCSFGAGYSIGSILLEKI